jgi:ankyrin repeat protein
MDAVKKLDVYGVQRAIASKKSMKGAIFELINQTYNEAQELDRTGSYNEDAIANIYLILDLIIGHVDPDEKDEKGRTPLIFLTRMASLHHQTLFKRFIDTLIYAGANVNAKEDDTPLLCAAIIHQNNGLIERLTKRPDLDYTATDPDGYNALHTMIWSYDDLPYTYVTGDFTTKVLELLIKETYLNAKTNDGKTAIDIATEQNKPNMLSMLEEATDVKPTAVAPDEIPPSVDYTPNGQFLPGFEVREFAVYDVYGRTVVNIVPVYVTTIPRGTLLFRGMSSLSRVNEDLFGIREDPGKYCLGPHYSVFFYPFPFVDETVDKFESVVIYRTVQDIKVACFINPSPMARADKSIRDMPIVTCKSIKPSKYGCKLIGREYDPCFNHEFLVANPDVTGMIAIAGADRTSLVRILTERPDFKQYLNTYFSTYTDSHSLYPGIPEIILYPRVTRSDGDVNVEFPPESENTAIENWLKSNTSSLSFVPYKTFEKRNEKALKIFLEQRIKNNEITIDKSTGFYVDKADHETPDHQLPSEEFARMSESFPELKFYHAQVSLLPDIATGGRSRRRTYRRRKTNLAK